MRAEKLTSKPLPLAVDRDTIAQIRARFLALNSHRLSLAKQQLGERQQQALDALPLLLHYNHPRLPGYLSKISPAGFANFTPTAGQQQLLRQMARGFRSQANPNRKMPLLALYVMGSVGTVAQSSKSDMDFWLCYSEELTGEAVELLQKKCNAIASWAKGLGLEWHFFLMQPDAFYAGEHSRLSSESSGSVQHFLLLDEFYRSAILLVGRLPLWWFIGDTKRTAYEATKAIITEKGFLRPSEWLDFGPVGDVPAAEFVSAAVWQLYKSIHSPYKSLLKLLMLEVYLSRYPQVLTLADKMKLLVYAGITSAATLDPYLLLLEELSDYFSHRREYERLELMRQCFYFKVGASFSLLMANQASAEKANQPLLEALQSWQWAAYDFDHLDRADNWNAQQVMAERKRLVNELTASYRQLLTQARSTQQALDLNTQEISILGRKLHAAFERSAGKIEFINPGISKNIRADFLLFEFNQGLWSLFLTNSSWEKSRTPIASNRFVSAIICWCLVNRIIGRGTRVSFTPTGHYQEADYKRLVTVLERLDYANCLSPDHNDFTRPPTPRLVCMLVNDPAQAATTSSAHYALFSVNSWGEVRLQHFGANLKQALALFTQPLPENCTVKVEDLHGQTPRVLLQQLHRLIEAIQYAQTHQPPQRLLAHFQSQWILVQQQAQWALSTFENIESGWPSLALPLACRHQLHCMALGPGAPYEEVLSLIGSTGMRPAIRVFYRLHQEVAEIFLIDERASLVRFEQPFFSEDRLLRPLHRFIRASLQRNPQVCDDSLFGIFPVNFFEMRRRQSGQLYAEQRLITSDMARVAMLSLQFAVLEMDFDTPVNSWAMSASLNGEPIHGPDTEPLLTTVARALMAKRQSGQRYPCYLTDLDLSATANTLMQFNGLQTSHYFRVKIRLEQALHDALLAL
ncbi:class I adenylate cyclase [Simiduia sp. 21SJ11W-1]|uniref:class I adenylate cyclase n=1 Tax=Simiduia sp. 21SJ11W-1 TaxID=2909669 RepID=UPI0020A22931|nr:class I adenylate cyclase [Simiduia sp. 21SJ11W-1]UTA47784.1 class I adenylate cyclase [Simiduia sp. 21SJ11W-1]